MIYNEHPGPWQTFLKRKDIIGLSPKEARKQYLIEQQGFNSGVAAAAAAAAAAGSNSSGGLVRETRIAAKKGYDIRAASTTTSRATTSRSAYETFFYVKPAANLVSGNSGDPVWELALRRGTPADFEYGYCVYDGDNYCWFLTNDPTNTDALDETAAYAKGPSSANPWGKYTVYGTNETITIAQAASSPYGHLYFDYFGAGEGNDSYIYKFSQSPITHNGAPVWLDTANSIMWIYLIDAVDPDGTFEDYVPGSSIGDIVGTGWQIIETDGTDIYDDISTAGKLGSGNAPYFTDVFGPAALTMLTSSNTPVGNFIQYDQGDSEESIVTQSITPNVDDITITADLQVTQLGAVGGSHIGTYTLNGGTINGRPYWEKSPYEISYGGADSTWQLKAGSTILANLDDRPLSPDGSYHGYSGSLNTLFKVSIEFTS